MLPLIFRTSRSAYVAPMLPSLHWLPSEKRIKYKLSLLCFNITSHQAPICLSELLHIYTPSRQLCSSAETCVFRIPSFWTKSSGQCSFSLYSVCVFELCVCVFVLCVCVCMCCMHWILKTCIKRMCKHLGPVQIRHSKYPLLLLYSGLTSSLTQFLQLTVMALLWKLCNTLAMYPVQALFSCHPLAPVQPDLHPPTFEPSWLGGFNILTVKWP